MLKSHPQNYPQNSAAPCIDLKKPYTVNLTNQIIKKLCSKKYTFFLWEAPLDEEGGMRVCLSQGKCYILNQ